jgi:HSP20 family protein
VGSFDGLRRTPLEFKAPISNIMNTLSKWNPFRELDTLQNRLGAFFARGPLGPTSESIRNTEWAPLVDVSEDEKEFLITAELPDMNREDVKVTAIDGTLRITGERKFEEEKKDKTFHRIERAYGSFERCFQLPEAAKIDALTAEYKNGVLKVHVPKSDVQKRKSIEVKVS